MVNFSEKLAEAVANNFSAIGASSFVDYVKLRKIIEGYEEHEKTWSAPFCRRTKRKLKRLGIF